MTNEQNENGEEPDPSQDREDPEVPNIPRHLPASEHAHHGSAEGRPSKHYIKRALNVVKNKWPSSTTWTTLATVVMAAATTIYAVYAGRQWKAINDQLPELHISAGAAKSAADTAKQTLVIDKRTWIEPELIRPEQKLRSEWLKTTHYLAYHFWITNIGKIPAKEIYIEATGEVLNSDQSPSFNYPHPTHNIYAILYPSRKQVAHAYIFDSSGKTIPGTNIPENQEVTPTLRQEFLEGTKWVAIYARGQFHDAFGEHWFRFCNWVSYSDRTNAYNSEPCVTYNDTGDTPESNTK
jgi:hypothetical protein